MEHYRNHHYRTSCFHLELSIRHIRTFQKSQRKAAPVKNCLLELLVFMTFLPIVDVVRLRRVRLTFSGDPLFNLNRCLAYKPHSWLGLLFRTKLLGFQFFSSASRIALEIFEFSSLRSPNEIASAGQVLKRKRAPSVLQGGDSS